MSLYNMMCGMNAQLSIIMSPFLPRIPEDFPRFRNIFTGAEDDPTGGDAKIFIYTRMGGGNRECTQEVFGEGHADDENGNCMCGACDAETIELDENCIERYDDDFDCTYCTFCYTIPSEWEEDFKHIESGNLINLSEKYWDELSSMYKGREKIIEHIAELRNAINNPNSKEDNEKI